jgi:hypothetical protein
VDGADEFLSLGRLEPRAAERRGIGLDGVGGDLAKKGQRRAWIKYALMSVFTFGIVSVIVGFAAVIFRQPFGGYLITSLRSCSILYVRRYTSGS